MENPIKVIFVRFLKGAIAGAVSAMIAFYGTGSIKGGWNDFNEWMMALTFAGTIGAIGGGLLALEKFFRLEETKEAIGKVFGKK